MFAADLPMVAFPASVFSQPVIESPSPCAPKILVIDTDSKTIDFLNNFLAGENCVVVQANSLNDAIEKYKMNKISLVVSEFLLGDHSCIEIIMMLRKLNPSLPIAIMSENEDLISEKDAINFSANYFLRKPLQCETLHNIIRNCTYQLPSYI